MTSIFDDHTSSSSTIVPPIGAGALPPPQPPRLIRICLIINDPHTDTYAGDFDLFNNWLNGSLPSDNTNVKYKLDPYWAQDQTYPTREDIEHYDALILSGSATDAFGDDPWVSMLMMFVQKVANEYPQIRILGICFGSQIIARALGGEVDRNPRGWEIGVTKIENTYMGKLLFGVEQMNLLLFHQDVVFPTTLSDSFTTGELYLTGSSIRTSCQGIVKFYSYHEQKDKPGDELVNRVHILTTQAHPEFTEQFVTKLLLARHGKGEVSDAGHAEYFGAKGHLQDAKPVLKQDTGKRWIQHYDGIRVIGRTFWRMLGVSYGVEHTLNLQHNVIL